MIDSKLGLAGFKLGMFLFILSGLMVLVTDKGTAEHAISVLTLLISLAFLIAIAVLARIGRRM